VAALSQLPCCFRACQAAANYMNYPVARFQMTAPVGCCLPAVARERLPAAGCRRPVAGNR